MNEDLMWACSQSFYKELYHFPETGHTLVMDETTGQISLRKELKTYSLPVFAYLKAHPDPHVPQVFSFHEENNTLTVYEEYIRGRTLAEALDEGLDAHERLRVMLAVCDGLTFLHYAEPPIIHRDLKASNIMLTDDGGVKLIDYDAAKVFHGEKERDTVLIGTEGSAAPEQYGFGSSDARTDIYAAGVLLRTLFPSDARLLKVADRATRMDPDDRYQSAEALKHAIERAGRYVEKSTAEQAVERPKREFPVPGFRTGKIWKMLVASGVYILIAAFALTLQVKEPHGAAEVWVTRIGVLVTELVLVDLFTGWTPLFRRAPLIHHRNAAVKILGYAVFAAAVILAGLAAMGLILTILYPPA